MLTANGLVLADDATGALECASLLAGLQLDVVIALSAPPPRFTGVCVVDTESRHVPPAEAAARMRPWAGWPRIFKKTDSTLRGNIAAELVALLERPVVYIPAYPALGRTVRNGVLFVHGVPVSETEFAGDGRNPVRRSLVADLFPAGAFEPIANAAMLAEALGDSRPRVLICDAVCDEELAAYRDVLRGADMPIASPAGFIREWAALAKFPLRNPPQISRPKRWLVVCGSRHPLSRRQARNASALGLTVIQSGEETEDAPDFVAQSLARRVMQARMAEDPDAILIMGGDTVRAVWRAMNIRSLTPLPELLPGIAACIDNESQMLFVTKAGGFGDDSLVERILESCNRL